jgi:trimeric autotransporter adhesin
MKKFQMSVALLCLGLLAGCSTSSAHKVVTQPTLKSIQITLAQASVAAGLGDQLTATGQYSDGTSKDLTATVAWTSSNQTVATVSGAGVISTAAQGTATITGSLSGVTGSATLTVNAPAIKSLTVSSTSQKIAQGTNVQFTATGTMTDGSTQNVTALVSWTSSNPSAVSINVNGALGLAMGKTPGTSTITATAPGTSVSSSAVLTVTSATLTSLNVTPVSAAIPLGTVQQFTATGTFSDDTAQDITGSVGWSSSPTSVATITVSGLATGKNLGTVTITATFGAITGSVTATVDAKNLVSITVLPANPSIAQNTSQQFSATGTFTDGSTHNLTAQAAWSSSNTVAATVGGSSGLAKGLTPGSSTITATLGTIPGSTVLEVTNATITSMSVSPSGRTIAPATQLQFTATGTFSDSSTQVLNRDATWASDNTAVATVGPMGLVTAVGSGTANIGATFGGVSGSTLLTVSSATLKSIAVTPASAVMAPASTLLFTATGTYSDGTTQNISNAVIWSSSASNVASITNFGQVTGQSAGSATITAQQGSVSGTAAVVVASSALTSLRISPPKGAKVAEQTGLQFEAFGTFADGSMQNLTASVTWTSSPASVATVSNAASSKGLATGVAPGSATIAALFAGLTQQAPLTVTNATLDSITIAPASPNIALGESQQFTATGNFSDNSTENLTAQVTWTSSSVNVATINADGLASTAGKGTTTITATMNGVNETATLTVN